MKTKITLLLLLAQFSFIYAQKSHKVNVIRLDKPYEDINQSIYFADYDASRRGSLIIHDSKNNINPVRILSEPPPDAIVAFTTSLSNSLKLDTKINASQTLDFSQAISELTKRNTTIVVLRDALYRLNEYDFNNPGKLDRENYLKEFKEILDLVREINDKEKKEAETENIKAQTEQILTNGAFSDNEKLGAKKNYQIAIQKLFEENIDDAKIYFKALYQKYPIHFNIDEINKELEKYEGKISDKERKEIFEFLIKNTDGIDKEIVKQINDKLSKIK